MRNACRSQITLALLITFAAAGQVPPEPGYGYEVASIRKSDPAARGILIQPGPQGGLRSTNTPLLVLITFAYDVRDYQVLDAPGWAKGEGYDVSFTPDRPEALPKPGEASAATMRTMMGRQRERMKAVLRDRFGLVLRMETRQLPTYGLVQAKGGHKLKTPQPGKGPSLMMNPQKGEITAIGADLPMLTNVLSNILGRPVVNETGLDGAFDLKLEWKPDMTTTAGPGEAAPEEPGGASIFTALTEQLGLRLESKKGPVTVYVVEKVERPGDN
jgi:uncharacterized protein (TIGR03435 family)